MTNLLDTFCSLPYLDEDSSSHIRWVSDRRLQRNLDQILRQIPNGSESQLLRYLLTELKSNNLDPLSQQHLFAYTTRFIAFSVKRIQTEMESLGTRSDTYRLFQDLYVSILESATHPEIFFKNYQINRAEKSYWLPSLKAYIRRRIDGKLCDIMRTRTGSKTYKRSDYGLVVRSSTEQVTQALLCDGFRDPKLTQHVLLWECFDEVRRTVSEPSEPASMKSKASLELYQAVGDRYNMLRKRLSPEYQDDREIQSEGVEQQLVEIGKSLRRYIDPKVLDLDRPMGLDGDKQFSLQDMVSDTKSDNEYGNLNQAELFSEMLEFQQFLKAKLHSLPPEQQRIPIFLVGLGMKQKPVGLELQMNQSTVGRHYKDLQKKLLQQVTEWAMKQESVEVDGDSLSGYQIEVSESIEDYFGGLIDAFFLQGFGTQPPESQELLRLHYPCEWSWNQIAQQFEQPIPQLEAQLFQIMQALIQILQAEVERQIDRPLLPDGPAQQHLQVATEFRLLTAPYSL